MILAEIFIALIVILLVWLLFGDHNDNTPWPPTDTLGGWD